MKINSIITIIRRYFILQLLFNGDHKKITLTQGEYKNETKTVTFVIYCIVS